MNFYKIDDVQGVARRETLATVAATLKSTYLLRR